MVYCNECKHEFEIKVRTKHIKDDIEEVFFNCPNCHERYTSYYTNDKIKGLQKQVHLTMPKRNGKTALMNKIKEEMNKLEESIDTQ